MVTQVIVGAGVISSGEKPERLKANSIARFICKDNYFSET